MMQRDRSYEKFKELPDDPFSKDYFSEALFHFCCGEEVKSVEALLKRKNIDVNAKLSIRINEKYYTSTCLIEACRNNNLDIVKLLLDDKRTQVNLPVYPNTNPLHYAAVKGNVEILRLMLLHPKLDKSNIFDLVPVIIDKNIDSISTKKQFDLVLDKIIVILHDQHHCGLNFFKTTSFSADQLLKEYYDDEAYQNIKIKMENVTTETAVIFSFLSTIYAYLLVLTKKAEMDNITPETSPEDKKIKLRDLLINAMHEQASDLSLVKINQNKFTERFAVIYECYYEDLLEQLAAFEKEGKLAHSLYLEKYLPRKDNAMKFLSNFFTHPDVENQLDNPLRQQFKNNFQSLPLEIRKNIAGFLFNVTDDVMYSPDEESSSNPNCANKP